MCREYSGVTNCLLSIFIIPFNVFVNMFCCTKNGQTKTKTGLKPQSGSVEEEIIWTTEWSDQFCTHILFEQPDLEPQSGSERTNFSITTANDSESSQIVSFSDKEASYAYEVPTSIDPTRMNTDSTDADLGNFFSRPIKIASYQWVTGSPFFQNFNPWDLYFTNLRVINRIVNFNLMRATLKVKIMINGNGFFYGRAIASYQPLPAQDQVTVNRSPFVYDVVEASQRPHIYIDPCYSAGGQLTLPFLWYRDNVSIPLEEYQYLGTMNLRSINALKHANGASESCTISVFAWAEDVVLSVPTSAEPGALAPQSGASDEYGTGPVSRPAGIVSRVAGMLTSAPMIGPFAKATELAASAVAEIARLYGYSRPVMISDPAPMKISTVGNLANSNITDQSTKLALDCKQELSIDPRISGIGGQDEMDITSFAMRESFLTLFSWGTAQSSETLLWNCHVTPMLYSINATVEYHMTPMAYVTMPFQYWRGSIEYRFQVVASNFHKGRLAISYDPYYAQTFEYNTQYTHIVDIADAKDFTIKVGWGNQHGWCRATTPGTAAAPYAASKLPTINPDVYNGTISVRVLNELTTPNSGVDNDIQVNVFVKACDDFEVAAPDATINQYVIGLAPESGLVPQSAEGVADAEDTAEPNAPVSSTVEAVMSQPLSISDWNKHVYFGEEIKSIRTLLKRYTQVEVMAQSSAGDVYLEFKRPNFPLYKGYQVSAVHSTSALTPFNYVNQTFINWFTPCFAGKKGGIRWKYHRVGDTTTNQLLGVYRDPYAGTKYQNTSVTGPGYGTPSAIAWWGTTQLGSLLAGAAETNTQIDPCVEVELPYYWNRRFGYARDLNPNSEDGYHQHCVYTTSDGITGNTTNFIKSMVSVGEDFSLFFFVSTPIVYYLPSVPAES
jgi:hypothetical protein